MQSMVVHFWNHGEEKINTKSVWGEANTISHGNTSLFHHLCFLFDVLFCLQLIDPMLFQKKWF
jgi:hypothetical protein